MTLFDRLMLCAVSAFAPQEPESPKLIGIDDLHTLLGKTVDVREKPLGWIDDEHYLVFAGGDDEDAAFRRVSAESGDRVAWLDRAAFERSLAALPGFSEARAREIAGTPDDFRWGKGHRAATLNMAGDLFHVDVADGAVRRLTHSPAEEVGEQLSPDGRLVAYVRDYNLHVTPVRGGDERPLTDGGHADLFYGRLDWVYQEELYGRGNFQGFWWSPDSSRIALLRLDESPVREFTLVGDVPTRPVVEIENYPKAGDPNPEVGLGVVPVRGGPITYVDLSRYGTEDILIVRVQWHPDGTEVYLQVQDRAQTWLDLLAADPETGEVRVVLREESDSWVEADAVPTWIADGAEFLWLSERDGFKHLYRYRRNGEPVARVTEGPWEVVSVEFVDEAAARALVTTTRTDVRDRHLWWVGFDGATAEAVTEEPGTHSAEVSPDGGYFLDTFGSTACYKRVAVCRIDGSEIRRLTECDMSVLAKYGIEPPEFHQVATRDGFAMEAMMFKPRGFKGGLRYPTMCFIYSGPHAPQVRNRFGRHDMWHHMLAQRGYLVWVCDNRSASGKGRAAASACYRDMGTTELRDLEDGVDWLVAKGYADPKRVGIWGWSYGGYQTAFCLTHSEKWKLGIAVNPVTDWHLYDSIYTERYMGLPQTNVEGYRRSSVVRAADGLHGRLLLVHATMDDNVHMQNSLQFVHALQAAGKQFDFMVYPRVRHGIANLAQQRHLFRLMTDFVSEHL